MAETEISINDYEIKYNKKLTQLLESYEQNFKDSLPSEFYENSVDWKLLYLFKNTEKKKDSLDLLLEKYEQLKYKNNNKFKSLVRRGIFKDYSKDFSSEWISIVYDKIEKTDLSSIIDPQYFSFLKPLSNACRYFFEKNSRSKENNKMSASDGNWETAQFSTSENEIDTFIDMEAVKKILSKENPLMFKIYEILKSNPKMQTRKMAALLGMADNEPEVSRKKTELLEILQREGFINSDAIKTLTPRQKAVLELYKQNPDMKQRDMMAIIGCTESAISRELRHLRNLGEIPAKKKKS